MHVGSNWALGLQKTENAPCDVNPTGMPSTIIHEGAP